MGRPKLVTGVDADLAYAAGQRVVTVQRRVAEFLRVGQKLPEIDRFVAQTLEDLDCESCFFRYRVSPLPPFPSYSCLSVNDCIVHGTAASYEKPLQPGDLLKVDIGVIYRGWIGDAAWTYAFRDYPSPQIKKLMESGKEGLRRGVQELRPGKPLRNWAAAVQRCVEGEYGFCLTRGLGGHGYHRRKLHEPPFVSNVLPRLGEAPWPDSELICEPGLVMAVEPMVALGTGETAPGGKRWPVYTQDGSPAVHYEHDVLVTASGPRVLTEGMETLPDLVG